MEVIWATTFKGTLERPRRRLAVLFRHWGLLLSILRAVAVEMFSLVATFCMDPLRAAVAFECYALASRPRAVRPAASPTTACPRNIKKEINELGFMSPFFSSNGLPVDSPALHHPCVSIPRSPPDRTHQRNEPHAGKNSRRAPPHAAIEHPSPAWAPRLFMGLV